MKIILGKNAKKKTRYNKITINKNTLTNQKLKESYEQIKIRQKILTKRK